MDKALRIKEKQEAIDKEVEEINRKNFDAIKERCRVDVEKKGERMDFLGRLHRECREAFREENILRGQEAGELLSRQIEQTQRLAEGVLRLKNKEIWEQKNRQVLRSRNIELKELEAQLKSTYAAKAIQVQLKERQASRDDEKSVEKERSVTRALWYDNDAFDRNMADKEMKIKIQYRNDIQDQLINNELMRQQRTEEGHRERKIVEQISEVLRNEDIQLAREKKERIAHVRAERDASFKAKEIWKCKEKEALLDEFNHQAKIIEDKMTEEKNEARKKSDKCQARDFMMEKTARQMLDDEVKRKEREEIVYELLIEEQNNGVAKAVKNEMIRKEIIKKELLADMERQKEIIVQSKTREAEVDAAFGKYLAEQYEIVVRNDKEKDHERRRKGIQHGKELKAMCEEQRALHAEEILARQELNRQDEEQELRRLEEVALERSKMLYEHAKNLHGFLRPGTMRAEDYEYIKMRQRNPEEF